MLLVLDCITFYKHVAVKIVKNNDNFKKFKEDSMAVGLLISLNEHNAVQWVYKRNTSVALPNT